MNHFTVQTFPALAPVHAHVQSALAGLPPTLLYHDIDHTLRDVFPAAMYLAEEEGLSARDKALLGAAALFHDLGYLDRYEGNEPKGAERARMVLPRFGFRADDLDIIEALILATAMPQEPETLLQRILCDADLSHLGSDRFFLQSERLRIELSHHGKVLGLRSWHEGNLRFLENHEFHTDSARRLWQGEKDRNGELVRELLSV